MKFLLSIFSVLCFVSLAKLEFFDGSCEQYNVSPMDAFLRALYGKRWFVQRLTDYAESIGQDCMIWDYQTIRSYIAQVVETSKCLQTQTPKRIESVMYFTQPRKGAYTYDISDDNEEPEFVKIIDTDYFNYSVEWSCVNLKDKGQCESFVYIITRVPNPPQTIIDKCESILREHNIDISTTRVVNQNKKDCGY